MCYLRSIDAYDNISIPLSIRIRSTSTSANSLIRLAAYSSSISCLGIVADIIPLA